MTPSVWTTMTHDLLRSEYSCSRMLGFCSSPNYKYLPSSDYISRVLSDKPEFLSSNDYVDKQYEAIRNDPKKRKTIKVLHMTDIHVDLEYAEGYNAKCNEPICCRVNNGIPSDPSHAAGKYGDYNCDLAPSTMNLFFDYIASIKDEYDLIFWTGDNIAHDVWEQSVEKNSYYTKYITDIIKEKLPNVPVYPILGNHEFFPVNVQSFDGNHPLIDNIAEYWADWLGPEGIDDFRNFGYYNIPLKGNNYDWSGVRVIGLNTEATNNQNWWLISQFNDPSHHLSWLETQLKNLEQSNEKAYIIGHVLPVGSSTDDFVLRYQALMERYQHVIIMHLFGHQHVENFVVIKDTKNTAAINSLHIPGGVNTDGDKNPAFRIYEVDLETKYPLKAHKYFFNLTAANLGNPQWQYMYELAEEYGVEDLSPSNCLKIAEKVRDDSDMANKYVRNRYTMSTPQEQSTCNERCQLRYYCSLANSNPNDITKCMGGSTAVDFHKNFKTAIIHLVMDLWFEVI